jgi:cytochrome c oxidase assembly protein subunit 15
VVKTPFGYLADHVSLGRRSLIWSTTVAWIFSIVIVFTGGVVRVTGSGLGCPTWPACDASSLAPTPELGINGLIEFSNRVFTGVIIVAVAWVIISARLQRPRVRSLTRLAWSQFWLVVLNAIAGGVSVLTGLNPWVVALHFVMAIALLTTTTLTWHRARAQFRAAPPELPGPPRLLAWSLAILTLILVVAGTLVSGSGPHSGAATALDRMGFDWTTITVVHGTIAVLVLVLACVLLAVLARTQGAVVARNRVIAFIVVVLAQGVIGVVQALTSLPDLLVALHLLGAALVWAGVLRVVLDVDPALFRGRLPSEPPHGSRPELAHVLTDRGSGL